MKFYGNKNNVFANALVSEYVTSNDFNIEVSTGKWLDKEIEKAMPDKDDFLEEIKKTSKKARKNHSFNKGERAQMKKEATKKRAKALGVKGDVEEGRSFYNAVAKVNHYATGKGMGRLYNAECRNIKRKDAEKRLMKNEDWDTNPWQEDVLNVEELYIPLQLFEAKEALKMAKKALEEKKEELKKVQFFLNSFEGEAADNMTVAECYRLYDHTASEEQRLLYAIDIYEDDVRYAETEYAEAKAAYDMLPFWVR